MNSCCFDKRTVTTYYSKIKANHHSRENVKTGLKKNKFNHPGQVDFPCGEVPFHSRFPNRQGIGQGVYQLNHQKSN